MPASSSALKINPAFDVVGAGITGSQWPDTDGNNQNLGAER